MKSFQKISCVILDRDGVINFDSPDYIKTPEEWVPIPGSLESIVKLNHAGFLVALATNQAGPAQGKYSVENAKKIFEKMESELKKRGGFFSYIAKCEHHPKDQCLCRKPKPGLLLKILEKLNLKPADCVFVGDSLKDIEAANSAGIKPVLVLTGAGLKTQDKLVELGLNIETYQDLNEFSKALLRI